VHQLGRRAFSMSLPSELSNIPLDMERRSSWSPLC
jgi:hypothetical protein